MNLRRFKKKTKWLKFTFTYRTRKGKTSSKEERYIYVLKLSSRKMK